MSTDNRAHLALSQLKMEINLMNIALNRRIDVLSGLVEQIGQQLQQHPVNGGGEDQVNLVNRVDVAINTTGDDALDGNKDKDDNHQDSVKCDIDTDSVLTDFDTDSDSSVYFLDSEGEVVPIQINTTGVNWLEEEITEDSGISRQQPEVQASIQPVAGPSGISRNSQKRPQSSPPRQLTPPASNFRHPNLADYSDDSDSVKYETDWEASPPPTKKPALPLPSPAKVANARMFVFRPRRDTSPNTRPFVCYYAHCGESFSEEDKLSLHIRQHRAQLIHRCEVCARRFTTKCELAKHQRRYMHSTEPPYRCPHPRCSYASPSKDHLERHLQSRKHTRQ